MKNDIYRVKQLKNLATLCQLMSANIAASRAIPFQHHNEKRITGKFNIHSPCKSPYDFDIYILDALREIMNDLLQIKEPATRRELFRIFHKYSFKVFSLATERDRACSDFRLNSESRKFLYLASGLSNSSNTIAKLIGELLGCRGPDSSCEHLNTQAQTRYVSNRMMKLYRLLLTELIRQQDTPVVAFFGASITQQKEDVSYVAFFKKAWESSLTMNYQRSINVQRLGYGGMHLGDAGLFYLGEVLALGPQVVMLEWHTTAIEKWTYGLLEKIIYTLYCNKILPIILILPKDCDRYYSPPLDDKFHQSASAATH